MSYRIILLFSLSVLLSVGITDAKTRSKTKGKKAVTELKSDSVQKQSEYEKFFKNKKVKTVKGFITLHNVEGKLYFELPLSLLGKPMLLGSTVSETSDPANGVVGSKPLTDMQMITFSKNLNKIQLRVLNNDMATDREDSPIAAAIKLNSIGSIVQSAKIETYTPDSTGVVFEMTDFFVSDNKQMSPFDPYSYYTMMRLVRTEQYQSNKSMLTDIKAFEDNVVIKSTLSYTYSLSSRLTRRMLVKDKPFTALMTRSIVLLPETPIRPRLADYRVNVFPTGKIFLGEKNQSAKPIYYANRWNLVPSDIEAYKRGEKVTPEKPITFYVDNNFPAKWIPYIKEGIEQWNELFETIGFKDAVRALDFPVDDPEFDPDNIKYSCVRYVPITLANAMGPSWVDPRSGEIINASVYVYHDIIKLLNNWLFVQTSQTDKRVRARIIPDEIIGDALRYVISHEIGHCLGYMHNMGASSNFPVDSLRSPAFTQKYGTTPSIMDYARFNYVAQPGDFEKGVKMTPPRFGVYDQYAIEWSYRYYPEVKTAEEEAKILNEFVEEKIKDPIYRWGVQLFRGVIDPRSQSEDLGDDAIKASRYGISNLKYIMQNFDQWVGNDDYDFEFRNAIYDGIVIQYLNYFSHVFTSIGGIYLNETKAGDPLPPFQSVEVAKQKAAMKFCLEQINELDWLDNKELMQKVGLIGSPKELLEDVIAQAMVMAPVKVRLSAALSKEAKPYDYYTAMEDLFQFAWKNTLAGKNPTAAEMKLQKMSIEAYIMYSRIASLTSITSNQFFDEIITTTPLQIAAQLDVNDRLRTQIAYHQKAAGEDYSIYGNVYGRYGTSYDTRVELFTYMVKVKDLLEKINTKGLRPEVASHYELILRNLKETLKVE